MNIMRISPANYYCAQGPQAPCAEVNPAQRLKFVQMCAAAAPFDESNQEIQAKRSINNMIVASCAVGLSALAFFTLVFRNKSVKFFNNSKEPVSPAVDLYRQNIAKAVSAELKKRRIKKTITPENLAFVVSKDEFTSGIDYSILNTRGKKSIRELLDDQVKQAAGKKVTLLISEKKSLDKAAEAVLEIIKNPEKYKNIRIIPGIKFSVKHNTPQNKCKVSEWSVYCVNPFSENLKGFISKLEGRSKRTPSSRATIERLLDNEPNIIIKR